MVTTRIKTATNTSVKVSDLGTDVCQVNIVNGHSAAIFVKFYDQTIATFQDTPIKTYEVKANDSFTTAPMLASYIFSSTKGLCVRAVTDFTDSGNTAPATLPIIEICTNA